MRILATAMLALAATPALVQETDGEVEFNNHCRTCHSLDDGDNRMGPSLHAIDGKTAGTSEGYQYSDALASSGVVWDAETLDAFIADPDATVPGNTMKPYSGLTDETVRAAIVSYLTTGDEG